jgi:Na+-transporting NADH:ubiquinone oxidoreductase subunit A
MLIRIRRGLDVRLPGAPEQVVGSGAAISRVAVLGADHVGLRPDVRVGVGDRVRTGEPLVVDRRQPGWRLTAPGAGEVVAVERGPRRSLVAVVVALDGTEAAVEFPRCAPGEVAGLAAGRITQQLVESGLWMALRARPFGAPAVPGTRPRSIFVTAIDTEPLAARPDVVLRQHADDFAIGVRALLRLTDGPVFVCKAPDAEIPVPDGARAADAARLRVVSFAGPHPAGLPGTHIHFLDPVGAGRMVWYVGAQDVIAIGTLLTRGRLPTERIVALGGPLMARSRLVRTRLGAALPDLLHGELHPGPARLVSGSALSGRHAPGAAAFLGRFHTQVTALAPAPAAGPPGPFLPVEAFRRVMPLALLPAPLLEALLIRDTDAATALGCLELEEDDLALAAFVCPARLDYGGALRACLAQIEKEG